MRRTAHLFSPFAKSISKNLPSSSIPVLDNNRMVPLRTASHEKESVPMLLLEGDKFCVGQNGICRTYYEIERWATPGPWRHEQQQRTSLSLEEIYDLKSARKTFQLRKKESISLSPQHEYKEESLGIDDHMVVNVGKRVLRSVQLQEICEGALNSAGTGSITWESSIAMSLYSSTNPDLLRGSILELGSGVGLGGMLLYHIAKGSKKDVALTLSDGNLEVIDACRENCYRANIPLNVKHLEWSKSSTHVEAYDTILASDCAYKEEHVVPLASTMIRHLKPDGRIHIFGPYNRATLQSLIVELRDRQNMDVQMNEIEMSRYRLTANKFKEEYETNYASRNAVKFIHAIVSNNLNVTSQQANDISSMHDVD